MTILGGKRARGDGGEGTLVLLHASYNTIVVIDDVLQDVILAGAKRRLDWSDTGALEAVTRYRLLERLCVIILHITQIIVNPAWYTIIRHLYQILILVALRVHVELLPAERTDEYRVFLQVLLLDIGPAC